MTRLHRLVRLCDTINEHVGRVLAWLTLAMVAVTLAVVVMRYGFSFGRIWIQEITMYLHAAVFMLGAAYTLQHRAHVRVDIFYRRVTARTRALIDIGGTVLFLVPVALLILFWSAGYVGNAWARLEGSPETGGLPLVFVLKSFIPAAAILLLLQAVAELARNGLQLAGHAPPAPNSDDEPGAGP